ncbi:DotD/TraH family lipoprotein [Morganella psychrotolerans]|uniref:DotD/TraH family lipoprotein n=1 Tax=Morganella psychrotolerans TaxID=368603 RepID=UPI0039AF8E98
MFSGKLAASSLVLLLAGCQYQAIQNQPPPDRQTSEESVFVAQQQILGIQKIINSPNGVPKQNIKNNISRVAVNWDGDAIELLSYLAKQRGQTFNWTGVRLPLPVNIHVSNITYQNLLRMLDLQISWRATIHEYPGQLTLYFSPHVNKGK